MLHWPRLSLPGVPSHKRHAVLWDPSVLSVLVPSSCVQSSQWEAALREAGDLLSFGRIDLHDQPMLVGAGCRPMPRLQWCSGCSAQHRLLRHSSAAVLPPSLLAWPRPRSIPLAPALLQVRFVASHLRRLFRSPQPWRELPVVFGLPRGCYSMRCAVALGDQLTTQRLLRWAGTHLLHLPPLPPLSSRLLGHWCAWAGAFFVVQEEPNLVEAVGSECAHPMATTRHAFMLYFDQGQHCCLLLRPMQVPGGARWPARRAGCAAGGAAPAAALAGGSSQSSGQRSGSGCCLEVSMAGLAGVYCCGAVWTVHEAR